MPKITELVSGGARNRTLEADSKILLLYTQLPVRWSLIKKT